MPECGEVRIITDQLNKEFSGQNLQDMEIVGGKFLKQPINKFHQLVFPLHNTQFKCRGKCIYWQFNEEEIFLIGLGMSGSFGLRTKHSAIKFTFDKGIVFFNDIRRFGNIKIIAQVELNKKLTSLGWDILQEPVPNNIIPLVRKYNNKTVAEVMMNQFVMSGCGNYLKCESCYDAKINPLRKVSDLTDTEITTLCHSLQKIVKRAYSVGGATIATFKDMYGNSGKFFDQFQVYGKKLDPLGNQVSRTLTKDGRSTYYVNNIQK